MSGGEGGTHATDWAEPGAFEVAPGTWRIPLPLPMDGLRAVNVYALETDEGLTLIDGGWAIEAARDLLEKAIAQIGYRMSDIRRFLVTHVHRDHYTQAVTVSQEYGSHVSLGIGERDTLDLMVDVENATEDPHRLQLIEAGAPELAARWWELMSQARPDPTGWAYPDTWMERDHRIEVGGRRLDAVSTPGHTRGHFVFVEPGRETPQGGAGVLFAGDHVLPTITPSIGFEPYLAEDPLGDFMGSLIKVRELPDMLLLPAHGPVTESSHARVDELLAHHEDRLAASLAAVRGGAATPYEVAAELPWTRHARTLEELSVFDAALATLETRAHLQLLAARGELQRHQGEGAYHYTPTPLSP